MNLLKNIVKDIKNHELILGVLLLLYLLSGIETPHVLSPYITNIFSYGVMFALAVIVFVGNNPILGILLAVTFVELVRRSNDTHPANVTPSQSYKDGVMNVLNRGNESIVENISKTTTEQIVDVFNPRTKTLEEEVIEKTSIRATISDTVSISSVQPTVSNNHNALSMTE
jgi:hypothetical protein